MTDRTQPPIISKTAYRTLISIMFSTAMVAWAARFFGLGFFTFATTNEAPLSAQPTGVALPAAVVLSAGVFYGCVLICLYWLYIERIANTFLPSTLPLLVLDFVALSFMAGAASSWHDPRSFVKIAACTLVLLSVRFGFATRNEINDFRSDQHRHPFRDMIMTHILGVYVLSFIFFLGALGLVALQHSGQPFGDQPFADDAITYFYYCVMGGMGLGIVTTFIHSCRHERTEDQELLPYMPLGQNFTPELIPAYHVVRRDRLGEVAQGVFEGEMLFRTLLEQADPQGRRGLCCHLSQVHSYRDVETQAFIMSYHAQERKEIALRAMWVYLTHWIDDQVDDTFVLRIATERPQQGFKIAELFGKLDGDLQLVWTKGVARTESNFPTWNREMLESGVRRLIIGGPLLSAQCSKTDHDRFAEIHDRIIGERLAEDDRYGVRGLLERIGPRYKAYTTKVVVETWDSFDRHADFDISMLMNLFYAPGLFYHDSAEECKKGEVVQGDNLDEVQADLKRVFNHIRDLPTDKLAVALRPVPMYIRAFERVLRDRQLFSVYEDFLRSDAIRACIEEIY